MTNRGTVIIAELKKNLDHSVALFKSLSPDELNTQVYQDGAQWTTQLVLAHFITIEHSMQWLFKNILAGDLMSNALTAPSLKNWTEKRSMSSSPNSNRFVMTRFQSFVPCQMQILTVRGGMRFMDMARSNVLSNGLMSMLGCI
jgi:hypothetical protein